MLRIQSKYFFLTYSQCDVSLAALLSHAKSFAAKHGRKIRSHVISSEEHKDSGLHRHCVFELDQKITNEFDSREWDINGHHPNLQSARNHKHVIGYAAKDGDYISDLPDVLIKSCVAAYKKKEAAQKNGVKGVIGKGLMEGTMDLASMLDQFPAELFNLERWKKSLRCFCSLNKTRVENLKELNNLYIVGPSGCGKSAWVAKNYPDAFDKPNNDWWNGFDPKRHKQVVFSDFDQEWNPWRLKVVADWYPFNARITADDPIYIRPEMIIVTSQYTIAEVLEKKGIKERELCDALERRFRQVSVEDLMRNDEKDCEMIAEKEFFDEMNELSNDFDRIFPTSQNPKPQYPK